MTIADSATVLRLNNTKFSRMDKTILVTPMDYRIPRSKDGKLIRAQNVALGQAKSYYRTCCWKVSSDGLERFFPGDSSHDESDTRTVFSMLSVTIPGMEALRVQPALRNVLDVTYSKVMEGPLITAITERLMAVSVFYRTESKLYETKNLLRVLRGAKIYAEELVILYAMARLPGSACNKERDRSHVYPCFYGEEGHLRCTEDTKSRT